MSIIEFDFIKWQKIYMSVNCAEKHSRYKGCATKILNDGWAWDFYTGKWYMIVSVDKNE